MDNKFFLPYLVTVVEVIQERMLLGSIDIGLSSIVLEGDSKITIDALMCEEPSLADYGNLVDEAKLLANQLEYVEFNHC